MADYLKTIIEQTALDVLGQIDGTDPDDIEELESLIETAFMERLHENGKLGAMALARLRNGEFAELAQAVYQALKHKDDTSFAHEIEVGRMQ